MATDDGCATFPTDDYGGNNGEHDHDDNEDAMGEWIYSLSQRAKLAIEKKHEGNHDDHDDTMGGWIYSLSQTAKFAIAETHEGKLSSPLPPSSAFTRPDETRSGTEHLGAPGRRE